MGIGGVKYEGMFNEKEYMKRYNKKYYIKNKEKLLKQHKQWQGKNPEYSRQYYKNNCESISEYNKLWNKNHPEITKKATEKWRENNPGRVREAHKKYMNIRYKTDVKCNLNKKIRHAIYKSLKGNKKGRHWEDLIGYTLNDLIKRLKSTMPKGYTWQDYLRGKLHIDHKIPISVFNFDNPKHIDFKRCWALKNLRLLPARENLIKHNKLNNPFQIALRI